MKRFICFIFCLLCLFNLVSCDLVADVVKSTKIVAVEYGSANEFAAEEFVEKGYKKVTYNSSSDVVLAVENGKADYGILDDFQLNSYIKAQRKLKKVQTCRYSISYCAYFSPENTALKNTFDKAIDDLEKNKISDKIVTANMNGDSYCLNKSGESKGTLVMLCEPNFDNRVYLDENENVVGLDVDFVKSICNNSGYDLEIVTADFDELFVKLENGEGDLVIAPCEITEERKDYFQSSDAYFTLNYNLIERE